MNLVIGSELINDDGHTVCVENILRESNHDGVEVFNFKVEDYHTYYVGESCILVHNADYDIELSRGKYPESAKHIEDAIADGQPEELTISRGNAKSNRKASLKGIDKVPGKDLDEYPFAMTKEGGAGADVRAIGRSDNRGSGSYLGHIFADQFGGSPELDNLVSQRSTLNRAVKGDNKTYRAMEKSWSDAMKNGKKVTDVDIKLSYKDGSSRPSSFKVSYKIDGVKIRKHFKN